VILTRKIDYPTSAGASSTATFDAVPPFKVAFKHQHRVLRAQVTGQDRLLATTIGYWTAIAAECRRLRAAAVLVVADMSGETLPPEQLPSFFRGNCGLGLEEARVAYVEVRSLAMSMVELAEIHARERGFNVRVFANETDAAMWLRHGET